MDRHFILSVIVSFLVCLDGPPMVFRRWSRTERSTRETLDLLKNRLDSATYEEDKLDALSELYDLSLSEPAEVGICCLTSLVKSMRDMDDISYQEKIIENVFRTPIKKDLVDKLCEGRENAEIFTRRSSTELSHLLDSIDSEQFYRFLVQDLEITSVIVSLLKNGCLQNVRRFLQSEEHLCGRVVFEGFLEAVLEQLALFKRNKAKVVELSEYYDLLLYLLSVSTGNQDYFIKAGLIQIMMSTGAITGKDIEVFSIVLNPLNRTYKNAQQILCVPDIIDIALSAKMYKFVHGLFDDNNEIFDLLLENHLNFAILLNDSEDNLEALEILENILRSSAEIPTAWCDRIMLCRSYRVNTLLHSLGFQHFDMNETLDQDLKLGKVTFDLIIFVILTRDTIEDVAQYVNFQLFEGSISDMCLLLYLLHNADLMVAPIEVRLRMARLRKLLCQEKVVIDSINEMLISTIGEVIKEHTCYFSQKTYSIKETNTSSHKPVDKKEESKNESFTDVNSKIKGLFSIFKQKDDGRRSFDL